MPFQILQSIMATSAKVMLLEYPAWTFFDFCNVLFIDKTVF